MFLELQFGVPPKEGAEGDPLRLLGVAYDEGDKDEVVARCLSVGEPS